MDYLLDTNICIYIIKRKPEAVFQKLQQIPLSQVFISTITIAELEYGVRKSSQPSQNQKALAEFLLPFSKLTYDSNASRAYGEIRAALERDGKPIGPLDTLIASQAKSSNCILVTNNQREFNRVNGLKIENWTS